MKKVIVLMILIQVVFANNKIEKLVDTYGKLGEINGVVLVSGPEGIIFKKAYGMANFEWNVKNTIDTKFRIGSLTKQFTAALILKLIEEGKLKEETKISEVLPWYRKETGEIVSIKQLLNHTSGIDRKGIKQIFLDSGWKAMPLKEEVQKFCSGDLEWEPGTNFGYNNSGYLILGAIIEEVTGKKYEDVLKEKILIPAGLNETELDDPYKVLPKRAAGYNVKKNKLLKPEFIHSALAASAGGLISTVEDLYKWHKTLNSEKVISNESKKKLFNKGLGNHGYGWYVFDEKIGENLESKKLIRHPGQGDGFYSIFWRIPEDNYSIIIINNTGTTNLPTIAMGILDVLYGRKGKISIASIIKNEIMNSGLEAGLEKFRFCFKNELKKYNFDEDEINTLAILFFRQQQFEEGLAMMELNTKTYPSSVTAWLALADTQLKLGNKVKAFESYKKVIKLNPDSKLAKEMIEKLSKEN